MVKLLMSKIILTKHLPLLLFIGLAFWSCNGNNVPKKNKNFSSTAKGKKIISNDMHKVEKLKKQDCVEVIRCMSPKAVAAEMGWTELYAVKNYKVSVWEKPTHQGKGRIVGEMLCGSRAMILDKSKDDYKIISPLDKSIGWVNEIQIEGTSFQHPISREDCKN